MSRGCRRALAAVLAMLVVAAAAPSGQKRATLAATDAAGQDPHFTHDGKGVIYHISRDATTRLDMARRRSALFESGLKAPATGKARKPTTSNQGGWATGGTECV